MFLALLPFHLVLCTHKMSTFLLSIMSASSLLFPVSVPTFRVPNFRLTLLTFLLSLFFHTDCPPLLLCLWPTVVQFPTVPGRLTALLVVVVDPTDPGWKSFLWFAWWFGFRFYAGCPSWRNPHQFSGLGLGLGPALFNTNLCFLAAVFFILSWIFRLIDTWWV